MKESEHQTADEARSKAEGFINQQLKLAREMHVTWKNMASETKQQREDKDAIRERMIYELARGLHTVMDSTSPAHADSQGWPVAYVGANRKLHSPNENIGVERRPKMIDEVGSTRVRLISAMDVFYDDKKLFTFPPIIAHTN